MDDCRDLVAMIDKVILDAVKIKEEIGAVNAYVLHGPGEYFDWSLLKSNINEANRLSWTLRNGALSVGILCGSFLRQSIDKEICKAQSDQFFEKWTEKDLEKSMKNTKEILKGIDV